MYLEVRDLCVDLKEFKLNNINLIIEEGEYLVLIGPTGSGKSVLLETIIGFYSADSGEILLNGKKINDIPPEKRGIGIVYQDNVLFPHMNVYENIAYGAKKDFSKEELQRKILDISKKLKINELLHRDVSTLSGGEVQRTALARALIVEPKIILMDEPFSALDISTQAHLTTLIKQVGSMYNTTFLHVTHNFNDVWNLADKVGVMKDGKIHQVDSINQVFSRPENSFVADFVGVANIMDGKIIEIKPDLAKIELNNGIIINSSDSQCLSKLYDKQNNIMENSDIKDEINYKKSKKIDLKVLISIRPEHIIFSNEKFESSARNQLKGKIVEVIKAGPNVWIIVDVDGCEFKGLLTSSSADILNIEKENLIYISFKSLNVNIIDEYHLFK
jgi:molybdopterin-binding protein